MRRTGTFIVLCAFSLLVTANAAVALPLPADSSTIPGEAPAVLARVADREITVRDFYERAEYTIRAPYCKGSSNVEKNIVLNTLIAEKLLALEAPTDAGLMKSRGFRDFLTGRREQKMREVLYYVEGESKVRLDGTELQDALSAAGRTYRIQYMPSVNGHTDSVIAGKDSVPETVVSWGTRVPKPIHRALFSRLVKKGEVLGPFELGDTAEVKIKVMGWSERVAVTQTDLTQRHDDVVEELTTAKADSIYDRYILKVMAGKSVHFNPETFNKLARVLLPLYTDRRKKSEDEFLQSTYGRNSENPELARGDYSSIQGSPLLAIDGKSWNVHEVMQEVDKHPLVFRKGNRGDTFVNQLRLAIVDLIRDRYLADAAYRKGLDRDRIVTHYEQTWRDASIAMYERDRLLKGVNVDSTNSGRVIEDFLNPHIRGLLKKYSGDIAINVEAYDKIVLTRTDMFTTQADVPYPIYVPAFPVLTTYNRLDYGRKMN